MADQYNPNIPNLPLLKTYSVNKGEYVYLYPGHQKKNPNGRVSFVKGPKSAGRLVKRNGVNNSFRIVWSDWFVSEYPTLLAYNAFYDTETRTKNSLVPQSKISFTAKSGPGDSNSMSTQQYYEAGATWTLDKLLCKTPLLCALNKKFLKPNLSPQILSLAYYVALTDHINFNDYTMFASRTRLPSTEPFSEDDINKCLLILNESNLADFWSDLKERTENDYARQADYWVIDTAFPHNVLETLRSGKSVPCLESVADLNNIINRHRRNQLLVGYNIMHNYQRVVDLEPDRILTVFNVKSGQAQAVTPYHTKELTSLDLAVFLQDCPLWRNHQNLDEPKRSLEEQPDSWINKEDHSLLTNEQLAPHLNTVQAPLMSDNNIKSARSLYAGNMLTSRSTTVINNNLNEKAITDVGIKRPTTGIVPDYPIAIGSGLPGTTKRQRSNESMFFDKHSFSSESKLGVAASKRSLTRRAASEAEISKSVDLAEFSSTATELGAKLALMRQDKNQAQLAPESSASSSACADTTLASKQKETQAKKSDKHAKSTQSEQDASSSKQIDKVASNDVIVVDVADAKVEAKIQHKDKQGKSEQIEVALDSAHSQAKSKIKRTPEFDEDLASESELPFSDDLALRARLAESEADKMLDEDDIPASQEPKVDADLVKAAKLASKKSSRKASVKSAESSSVRLKPAQDESKPTTKRSSKSKSTGTDSLSSSRRNLNQDLSIQGERSTYEILSEQLRDVEQRSGVVVAAPVRERDVLNDTSTNEQVLLEEDLQLKYDAFIAQFKAEQEKAAREAEQKRLEEEEAEALNNPGAPRVSIENHQMRRRVNYGVLVTDRLETILEQYSFFQKQQLPFLLQLLPETDLYKLCLDKTVSPLVDVRHYDARLNRYKVSINLLEKPAEYEEIISMLNAGLKSDEAAESSLSKPKSHRVSSFGSLFDDDMGSYTKHVRASSSSNARDGGGVTLDKASAQDSLAEGAEGNAAGSKQIKSLFKLSGKHHVSPLTLHVCLDFRALFKIEESLDVLANFDKSETMVDQTEFIQALKTRSNEVKTKQDIVDRAAGRIGVKPRYSLTPEQMDLCEEIKDLLQKRNFVLVPEIEKKQRQLKASQILDPEESKIAAMPPRIKGWGIEQEKRLIKLIRSLLKTKLPRTVLQISLTNSMSRFEDSQLACTMLDTQQHMYERLASDVLMQERVPVNPTSTLLGQDKFDLLFKGKQFIWFLALNLRFMMNLVMEQKNRTNNYGLALMQDVINAEDMLNHLRATTCVRKEECLFYPPNVNSKQQRALFTYLGIETPSTENFSIYSMITEVPLMRDKER